MLILRFMVWMLGLAVTMLGANLASGQNYPSKPIRMLTTEPGGGGDVALRLIGAEVAASLGQPFVLDNRPLSLGGEIVARAVPDGYTVAAYGTSLWMGALLQPMNFDPLKDFAPITIMTRSPNLLVVHPSLAVNSASDLIALAKAKPGVFNYGSGNSGAISHLSMELFKFMAGINVVRIPYKGSGPAANALAAGEVQMMIATATSVAAQIKSGRIKALAVTTIRPSPLLPDLPTVAASGLPGYESASIYGIVTTAKTPATVVQRLNQEMVRALHKTNIREIFLSYGVEAVGSTPEEFSTVIKSETERMGKVIRDAGIRVQ